MKHHTWVLVAANLARARPIAVGGTATTTTTAIPRPGRSS
jgi:hypothetical protein